MQTNLPVPIVRSSTISCFDVTAITDRQDSRTVIAEVSVENVGPVTLTLWEADDYISIGQWTDTLALARVKEIIQATYG